MIDGRAQAEVAANEDAKDRRIAELELENARLHAEIARNDNLAAWRNQRDELIALGYSQRPPTSASGVEDDQAAAQATCEECGHVGMRYAPFFRTSPRSYRAFAVCHACAAFIEF